jgi:hypothetical protein
MNVRTYLPMVFGHAARRRMAAAPVASKPSADSALRSDEHKAGERDARAIDPNVEAGPIRWVNFR